MKQSEPHERTLLVVIVNYFSATLVAKLIDQLNTQAWPKNIGLSLVCADNSASTEQATELKRISAQSSIPCELILNSQNLGFGNAINSSAEGRNFDYLCCINPDVTLRENTFAELLQHARHHRQEGIWGGLTVDSQQAPDWRHAWQEPTLHNTAAWAFGIKRLTRAASWQDNYRHMANLPEAYPVDAVSGCCMIVSNSAWQQLEGFDPDFFLYSEETDLCRRSRRLGFQPTVVPSATLHHAPHSTAESNTRLLTIYSSKLLYASKHHGWLYNICYRMVISLGSLIRSLASLVKGNRKAAQAWAALSASTLSYRPAQPRVTS